MQCAVIYTRADGVRVYIDSAHDVTGEAERTLYRYLAATDLHNLELPAVEPGETQKLDIGLVVPGVNLELKSRRIAVIQHACARNELLAMTSHKRDVDRPHCGMRVLVCRSGAAVFAGHL
jgi:hypothetical protein